MENCILMGIVNLTDNSFFSASRVDFTKPRAVVDRVEQVLKDGADIVDIGACSTAPGNLAVSEREEWKRLEGPLGALFEAFPNAAFSIDSFRPGIVRKVLKLKGNADNLIVNDVLAGEINDEMLRVVADNGLEYVAMDSSDNPAAFFAEFLRHAERYRIDRLTLDPGFGFGKSIERNWEILNSLGELRRFGRPILAALSHKRMIYMPLGLTPETCTEQSVEAECLAVSKGADIVRTHDVALLRNRLSQL